MPDKVKVWTFVRGSGGLLGLVAFVYTLGLHNHNEHVQALEQRLQEARDSEQRIKNDMDALRQLGAADLPRLIHDLTAVGESITLTQEQQRELQSTKTALQLCSSQAEVSKGLLEQAAAANEALVKTVMSSVTPQQTTTVRLGSSATFIPNYLTVGVEQMHAFAAPAVIRIQRGDTPAEKREMSAGEMVAGQQGSLRWWLTLESIDGVKEECVFRFAIGSDSAPLK